MTMKKCSGFHNNALASFDREALSIPAGAATETADKMPMIVISLSRYSKYCFTSTLAYLKHGIDFSLDNRMSFCCDGEGLAILRSGSLRRHHQDFGRLLQPAGLRSEERRVGKE